MLINKFIKKTNEYWDKIYEKDINDTKIYELNTLLKQDLSKMKQALSQIDEQDKKTSKQILKTKFKHHQQSSPHSLDNKNVN